MQNRLRFPTLIVFTSNTCVMILELVAGRIVAPYIGVSLYTWTSVIGIILAGMSVGNYWGGKIADRSASRRTLGLIFIIAGLFSFSSILMLDVIAHRGIPVAFAALPLIGRILLIITAIFFLPSTLLGMISPLVVKLSLLDLNRTGETIGRIYAASAFGSILGTFATGFFLISWFGTRAIIIGVAVVLVALGIFLGNWFRKPIVNVLLALALLPIPFLPPAQKLIDAGPCLYETNYFCIKVYDQTVADGSVYKALVLDRLVHSFVDPQHPEKLEYSYERIYPEVLQYLREQKTNLRVLVIGGGGYSLPRYIEAIYPDILVDVIEIDPGVTEAAYQHLGLSKNTSIRTYNEDGRLFMTYLDADVQYDLILLDAVNDLSVPYHLTTVEFNQLIANHLTPDGLFMTNMIDGRSLKFVSAYLNTIRQTFPNSYLIPTSPTWETNPRTTFDVISSPQAIDIAALEAMDGNDSVHDIASWRVSEQDIQTMFADVHPIILTDNYVPVDNLLASTVAESEEIH